MLTLVAIGLVAGLVTALSPCVLPVLPGILAASSLTAAPTTGAARGEQIPADPRRPYLIVAGLLTSFTLLTLLGATLVTLLGLDEGILRTVALVVLIGVGLGLLIPGLGQRMEQLFWRIPHRGPVRTGSAFLFGLTLGVVFVPCAGPVLAAITVLAASQGLSSGLVTLTLAFSAGLALPLLLVARLGGGLGRRLSGRTPAVRRVAGAVFLVTGLALALGLADTLQRAVPGYVSAIQQRVEDSQAARDALASLSRTNDIDQGRTLTFDECERGPSQLADCGPAPEFTGIEDWLNTANGQALTLRQLSEEGRVVLVDFWTYSCINCQRTLPYLTAWDAAYRDQGLTIVGVHSPEFAFERQVDNVAERAADFGVEYPIAIDNDFATWRAYHQRYWPAKYLIDRSGRVRQVHYGEGAYAQTEELIRQLLAEEIPAAELAPANTPTAEAQNHARTPETYLGHRRARAYSHPISSDTIAQYDADPPSGSEGQDKVTLSGEWTVRDERIDAGPEAALTLDYSAGSVFLVLGGEGTALVTEHGTTREIVVSGAPTLYELRSGPPGRSQLQLRLEPGMSAYAFTFG